MQLKRCHFISQLSGGLFGQGGNWEEPSNSIVLHFLFYMNIWSPDNHSQSGTSSCIIQQNGRGNRRAFSLHTLQKLDPRTNKHGSLLVHIKKIEVWKHLMIFFCGDFTCPHSHTNHESPLKACMQETNILWPDIKIWIWGAIFSNAPPFSLSPLLIPPS